MKLSLESIVVASKEAMASDLGGETVILGLTAGMFYGLDAVGARVWQIIQSPSAVANVQQTILSEYDVEPERCEADLLDLLQKMIDAGLVEVRNAGR